MSDDPTEAARIAIAVASSRKKGKTTMPEIGGKALAGRFGKLLADLKKESAAAEQDIAAAGAEFMTEVAAGKAVAKAIRDETAAMRGAFADVLGNAPPQDPAEKT